MNPIPPHEREAVEAFLRRDVNANIFLLSVLHRSRDRDDALALDGVFFGWPHRGPLAAVVYVTPGGLCVPFSADGVSVEALGRSLRGQVRPRLLVGPADAVDRFWSGLRVTRRVRLFRDHQLYVLRRGELSVDPDPEVRPARPRDLEVAVDFSARMQAEELGVDPRTLDERRFRRRITRLVSDGQLWILSAGDLHGFQASASSCCPQGVQVEAVFTPPALRGRGWATRGLGGMCHALLESYPVVTLHVNRENYPALRLYERVGFVAETAFRLISC